MSRAPRRLLDDPNVAAQLRGDLASARAQQASFDPERGLARLRGALDGVQASAAWSESVRAIGARWWGLAASGVATVGAVWWIQHASPVQSTPRAPSQAAAPAPAPERSAPQAASEQAPPALPAALAPPVSPPKRARPIARKPEPAAIAARAEEPAEPREVETAPARVELPAARVEPPNELEHLARLRRLLKRDPRQALEAARDGQARFARGLFVEERAGMIVFALERLGESHEAMREGQRFLLTYPQGLFSARVRVIVTRLEGERK